MKFLTLLTVLSFSLLASAADSQLGPKVDYNQLDKATSANRGDKPVQGRGPASVETADVKKEETVKKGLHINKKTDTYRDTLIQPKY